MSILDRLGEKYTKIMIPLLWEEWAVPGFGDLLGELFIWIFVIFIAIPLFWKFVDFITQT